MGDFKRIENEKFISNLFRFLARQKVIPVYVYRSKRRFSAWMLFDDLTGNRINLRFEKGMSISVGSSVRVTFSYKDVLFFFDTDITEATEDVWRLQKPSLIFSPFERLIARYKVGEDEEAMVFFHGQPKGYKLLDISARGLSFASEDRCVREGELIRCVTVKVGNDIEVLVDASVRYCKRGDEQEYIYGLAFLDMDWMTNNKLFNYIFEKTYPNIRPMEDFSNDEIYKLYADSGYLDLKSRDEMDINFSNMMNILEKVRYKSQISTNVVYYKEGKLLTGASLMRIYDRTFLGHQLASVPEARFVLRTKTDIYMGFAEFMLNHPYGKYHLAYFEAASVWQNEMYRTIGEYINDKNKFYCDTVHYFECYVDSFKSTGADKNYRNETLYNPSEFIRYCQKTMEPLVAGCYAYNTEHFQLMEIKHAYEMVDMSIARRLWRITMHGTVVAYAVAEVFTDGLNLFNFLDMCRVYFTGEEVDIKQVLQALLPEVIMLFKKYKKKKINVFFKADDGVIGEVETLPGVSYMCLTGRAFVNQEGMSEHKKLLAVSTR